MKRESKCRGQALIEFALILPLLLFVLVFAYYAFFIISDSLTLQQMAREAARLGATNQQIAFLSNIDPQNPASESAKRAQAQVLAEVRRFGNLHFYTLDNVTVSINAGIQKEGDYVHAVLRMKRRAEVPAIDGLFAFFPKQFSIENGSGFPPEYFLYHYDMRPQRATPGGYY